LTSFVNNEVERTYGQMCEGEPGNDSSSHEPARTQQQLQQPHQSQQLQSQPESSSRHNIKIIEGGSLSSRTPSFHIIACQDEFTYHDISIMPFKYPDLPPSQECNGREAHDYDAAVDAVTLCQHIRHVMVLFDDLFTLGISLIDSIHNHTNPVSL
jgi:hypothetical protein